MEKMRNVDRRECLKAMAAFGVLALGAAPRAWAAPIKPGASSALIVVDVQNCFVTGGTLPVKGGEEVVPIINTLARGFQNVVITQDWHTPGHASFASSHPGKKPFETTRLRYGTQVLWPDHCVQGSQDAAVHKDIDIPHAQLVIRKGWRREVDSYSGFIEGDRRTRTGLEGYLRERGIEKVFVCGLATDFCVAWTALDARKLGFEASVIEDGCRAIDTQGSLAAAWADMDKAGVRRVRSAEFD